MKNLLSIAAVAAMLVVAPLQAAEKPAAANSMADAAQTTMSPDDCKKAIADCKGDKTCLDALAAKNCKPEQQ